MAEQRTVDDKLAGDKLVDIVSEYAQRLVEVLSSEGLLKEIPIVKTLMAGVSAVELVSNAILLKKLRSFVESLENVSSEQRQAMIRCLESDPSYHRCVGEHIIELVDRVESGRKPRILGEIFAALARQQIDLMMFRRLISAVESLPTYEIDVIRPFSKSRADVASETGADLHPLSLAALANAGLASRATGFANVGSGTRAYAPTSICRTFVELDLDTKSVDTG